jgi:hypothetical protein
LAQAMPLRKEWMRDVLKIAGKIPQTTFRMVAESHADIAKLFNVLGSGIKLWHLDAHHDLSYSEEQADESTQMDKADCGSWVLRAMAEGRIDKVTMMLPDNMQEEAKNAVTACGTVFGSMFTAGSLHGEELPIFDAVFLCRSPEWTPPIYDGEFNAVARALGMETLPVRQIPIVSAHHRSLVLSCYGKG